MSDDINNWEDLFDRADEDGRENSLFQAISTVDSRYDKVDLAGSGAMKNIIRTEDKVSGRMVAKAVLKNPADEHAVESFLREARITALLQHPNIVPLYDMGIDEENHPFFTMKLIKGSTLKDILTELENDTPKFIDQYPLSKRIDIFLKVCEAMAYAHSEGIAHLDLKPENITVSTFGDVIICDWGLATIIGSEESNIGNPLAESFDYHTKRYYTLCGEIKGTPGYMAPEQAKGADEIKDERTDIYALGSIFYELLTLKKAIPGNDLESIVANTIRGEITPPILRRLDLSISSSLEAVCLKALQIDASQRYQNVEDIITDIDAYRQGFVTAAEDFSFIKQVYLLYKRNQQIFLVAFFLIFVIITGSLYFIESLKDEKQVSTRALEESEKLHELNKKISKAASEGYSFKGRNAYYRFESDKATEVLEASLSLNPENVVSLSFLARILCVQQQFVKAHEKLKLMEDLKRSMGHKYKMDNDLLNLCLALSQYETKTPLNVRELYPFVKKTILKDDRHVLKAQIYAWAIMNTKREVDDELAGLESDIVWLLSQENNKNVHGKLYSVVNGFHLDLSGNGKLLDIRCIGQLSLKKLDLRACQISYMSFIKQSAQRSIHLKYLDSFRKTKILLLDKGQEISEDSFKRAEVLRY